MFCLPMALSAHAFNPSSQQPSTQGTIAEQGVKSTHEGLWTRSNKASRFLNDQSESGFAAIHDNSDALPNGDHGKYKRAFKFGKKSVDSERSPEAEESNYRERVNELHEFEEQLGAKRAFKFGKKSIDASEEDEKRAFKFGKRSRNERGSPAAQKPLFKFGKKSFEINNGDNLGNYAPITDPKYYYPEEELASKYEQNSMYYPDDKRAFKFGKKSVFFPDVKRAFKFGKRGADMAKLSEYEEKRAFKFGKKSVPGSEDSIHDYSGLFADKEGEHEQAEYVKQNPENLLEANEIQDEKFQPGEFRTNDDLSKTQ
jgi:hypothetical protein